MTACTRCRSRYISESQEGAATVRACLVCGRIEIHGCAPCPGCGSTARTRHSRAVAPDTCAGCAMQFTEGGDVLPRRTARAAFGVRVEVSEALNNMRRQNAANPREVRV